jgi:hypothetical protein
MAASALDGAESSVPDEGIAVSKSDKRRASAVELLSELVLCHGLN